MVEFISTYLFPFESGALNAAMYAVFTVVIPALLMGHTSISLKTPTRNKLLINGGGLIIYCILIAPLLMTLLDTVGKYEKEYETCQLNYIYTKIANPNINTAQLKACEPIKESSEKELNDFKTMLVICSILVNVVLISLGVNLIASASSMSNERICQDNIHEQIDNLNEKINNLSSNIWLLALITGIPLIVVLIAVFL
ncbi:hypothetical protein HUZ36_15975 [Pseudoalteromonas sp. McH1-7]|uniref:hypothetical protein n=1 Tax=Pseudoalteromonas TaxID=53246 RepID=UPI00158FB524|nr:MULTISPECIES: hypothetical protein [Pseudoalteromonas]MDW7551435.1 hypothetical protein [Pseudoalteromonas peptidolytica]NUZ12281.1 hypothetical protein [Pseudoalteromonas sp. McH1-7]USD30800.1 hypothetical protein J8Z24_17660 [Pseudoalteromonas sp. SCSIO 43201]